jgi:hypothetical protein
MVEFVAASASFFFDLFGPAGVSPMAKWTAATGNPILILAFQKLPNSGPFVIEVIHGQLEKAISRPGDRVTTDMIYGDYGYTYYNGDPLLPYVVSNGWGVPKTGLVHPEIYVVARPLSMKPVAVSFRVDM